MANLSYKLDEEVKKIPEGKSISLMLDRLKNANMLERFPGNCISASDIIQNMLNFYGINSKVVECQLMAVKRNSQINDFCFVGFDEIGVGEGSVDSHVVVVTQTAEPVLIDASVGNLLSSDNQIIVKKLNSLDPDVIAEFQIDDMTFTYQPKKNVKLPGLHQKNLIERLKDQAKTEEKMHTLSRWVIIGLAIGGVNILFNLTQLILRLFGIG